MLESFIMYEARKLVSDKGKDSLLDFINIQMIISTAFIKRDKALNRSIKSESDYIAMVHKHKDLNKFLNKLKYFYYNIGKKKYDDNLNIYEKREIFLNSIRILKPFIQDLKDNYDYDKFQDINDNKKTADFIIENLLTKINDDKELNKILKSLNKIKFNFWIEYDDLKIYPLITDLLEDIISLEYAWTLDKKLIQAIIGEWQEAVNAQKNDNFFTLSAFSRMELIEKVKYSNLRNYLLAEYSRILNVDKKNLRMFILHIIYYIVENHTNTMKVNFDIIKSIPKRMFLLERTQMIIVTK